MDLTPNQLADLASFVGRKTSDTFIESLKAEKIFESSDEKIIKLASSCAGIAAAITIQYVQQLEQISEQPSQGLVQ